MLINCSYYSTQRKYLIRRITNRASKGLKKLGAAIFLILPVKV